VIVVDDDCDVRDWDEVMWRVALGVMPDEHIRIGPRTEAMFHEPMLAMYGGQTSTVTIDATFRSKRRVVDGEEVGFPPVNKVSRELRARVEARWGEYGLG
jgi:3-polyprenyl-4-hydroxybenzoate decarboxylase